MSINPYVSDLFFNLDHSSSIKKDDHGNFVSYDDISLMETAKWFCDAINSISNETVSQNEIVQDFYDRL